MVYKIDSAIEELKALSLDTPKKPKLPDDELLDKYEARIGFKFSNDYRKFLKYASDVFVGVLSPFVLTENADTTDDLAIKLSEARTMGLPYDWLPICEDNGDYYCLLNNGEVRFWSHNGVTDEIWPDLATWIEVVWIGEN